MTQTLQSHLFSLPAELLHIIGSIMTPQDLNRLVLTNRHMSRVFNPLLWSYIRKTRMGSDLIVEAAENGNLEMLKKLIEGYGVSPSFTLFSSPFPPAAEHGQTAVIEYLMRRYPDQIASHDFGHAIELAAISDHHEVLNLLLCHSDVDKFFLRTALSYAVMGGKVRATEALANRLPAAAIDASLIAQAIKKRSGSLPIFKVLLDRGTDITGFNSSGWTLFYSAAVERNVDILEFLLERGIDVNIRNNDGENALDYAVERGDLKVARFLLEKGAQVTAPTPKGAVSVQRPVAHLAKAMSSLESEEVIDLCCRFLSLLVAHGADINESFPSDGRTPLHKVLGAATMRRGFMPAKRLVEMGANVNAIDKDGGTPLHYASGNAQIVLLLLGAGANPRIRDKHGRTVLKDD